MSLLYSANSILNEFLGEEEPSPINETATEEYKALAEQIVTYMQKMHNAITEEEREVAMLDVAHLKLSAKHIRKRHNLKVKESLLNNFVKLGKLVFKVAVKAAT